jgi:hypothetical protein
MNAPADNPADDQPILQPGERDITKTTEKELFEKAVQAIAEILAPVPINIALAALAHVVGQAQFSLQKNPVQRVRNIELFMAAALQSVNAAIIAERSQQIITEGTPKAPLPN